jgi:hypothetical protein
MLTLDGPEDLRGTIGGHCFRNAQIHGIAEAMPSSSAKAADFHSPW